MTILEHHYISALSSACASNHAPGGLDAVAGEAVRPAQIEEPTS